MEDLWTKLFGIELQCNEWALGFWKKFGLFLHRVDGGELALPDIASRYSKSLQTGIMPGWKVFNFSENMSPIN